MSFGQVQRTRFYGLLLIIILLFIFVMFIPTQIGFERNVILQIDSSQVKVASTSSEMTVHYVDGSAETIKGEQFTVVLGSIFRMLQITTGKTPDTMDFKAQVVTLSRLDLKDPAFCIDLENLFGILPPTTYCPVDVAMVVDTDISMTVNGEVAYTSPSNKRIVAMSQEHDASWEGWFALTDVGPVPISEKFSWGQVAVPFSLTGWNPDKYILESPVGTELTFKMVGEQKFSFYFIYFYGNPVQLRLAPDKKPFAEKTLNYDDPTYKYAVPEVKEPDFIPDITPDDIEIGRNPEGNKRTLTLSAQAVLGFNSPITWIVESLPQGITHTVSPNPTPAPTQQNTIVSSYLTLGANPDAELGNRTVTIRANGGGKERTVGLLLRVVERSGPQNPVLISTKIVFELGEARYNTFLPINLKGKLVTASAGGGITGKQIQIASEFGTGQGITDRNGAFSIFLNPPREPGTYKIQARFEGDNTYDAAYEETVITVTAIDQNLIWIIIIILIIALIVLGIYAMTRRRATGMISGGR